ncbi:hypothetical protein O6H91_12G086800 [Diphasiastrum complanatum]|uniref:Uncharacterized protein n=1 Tax=Diphasiastrum complanatum TaxID=34168 RepID=A0ACC2C4L5_DIPCM|nr:hypothetical protein O6H91_12G086800 [Diphasiastrum complanatum]
MSVVADRSSSKAIPRSPFKQDTSKNAGKNDIGSPGPSADSFDMASNLERVPRSMSRGSIHESEGDETEAEKEDDYVQLGPLIPLKQELEQDKEDESLRRWKEQLLGSIYLDPVEEHLEPEVRLTDMTIISNGRPDIPIPMPFKPNTRGHMFTLKEGSCYSLKFTFVVRHNIVPGLTYINTIWKNGLRVDNCKVMLGTFSPHLEPYTHTMEEEVTPSGMLARGAYTARTKFVDDDKRCHLQMDYSFEIRKDW